MPKFKKIILTVLIILTLVFIAQKVTNFYIEQQINSHLSQFGITADLERLQKLTLRYKSFTLPCKIKIEDKAVCLVPINQNFLTKLINLKIPLQIPLPFA